MSFYKTIAGFYDEIFPLKDTKLSFITSLLNKERLAILDIGCAGGDLALALSKKGHRVTALDRSREMVDLAREKAKNNGSKVEFLEKDMENVGTDFSPSSFDAVLCFGNTLVHLENPGKMEEFFKGVLKILKDEGIFLLQIVNYDHVLAEGLDKLPTIERENFIFRRNYFYDADAHRIRFRVGFSIKDRGVTEESVESLYPLTFAELNTALTGAGFSDLQFFGSEDRTPFRKESPALIAAGSKRKVKNEK